MKTDYEQEVEDEYQQIIQAPVSMGSVLNEIFSEPKNNEAAAKIVYRILERKSNVDAAKAKFELIDLIVKLAKEEAHVEAKYIVDEGRLL